MAANAYEGMFILDSNRYGRDPETVSGRLAKMIEKAGGQMLVSRLWEERRLAYPIKGHRKGTYWLTYFRLGSDRLAGVRRECQLNDDIVRVLFLQVDPRIIDTLVEHAKSGQIGSAVERSPATAGKGDPEAVAAAEFDPPDDAEPEPES